MHGHDQTALHIQKVGQHPVIQLRRENLQEGNLSDFPAHGEVFAVSEGKGAGRDKVLHGKPGGSQPVPVKEKRLLLVHVEDAVEQFQTLLSVHRISLYAQPLKVVQHIGLNALQPELGAFQRIGLDAEGQVLGLDKAIVAFGQLIFQHLGVFGADAVVAVALQRNGDALRVGILVCRRIDKGQLKAHGAVKVVEEVAPAVKDSGLVLVLIQLVVDVLELHRLGVVMIGHAADAVREHTLKGDGILCGFVSFVLSSGVLNGSVNLLLFRSCELFRLGQSSVPPYPVFPAALRQNRSCWFCMAAPSGG